jgi:nucleoside-diphosphate-sugar epimerase
MSTLIVGCGYLGSRIGRQLANRQEPVFGTVRTVGSIPSGITPLVADVLDPASLVRLPEVDRVVYCVGFDRSAGIPMRRVYVEGLANVLDVLGRRTKRVLYVSSTGVYGQTDGGWVDEDSPAEPSTESGRVCLEAEHTARRFAERDGFELVLVRYSGLYGPDRIIGRDALRLGKPIVGDPDRYLNLIHVDDAATAAILALDHAPARRLYLASDDEPMLRRDYYERLSALLPDHPPLRFVSPEPGSPAALREGSNKRVGNRRIKTELGLQLVYPNALSASTFDD